MVADIVADMEVDMVDDMVADMVAAMVAEMVTKKFTIFAKCSKTKRIGPKLFDAKCTRLACLLSFAILF